MHKEDPCEPHDHCYFIDPSAKVYSVLDACSVSLDKLIMYFAFFIKGNCMSIMMDLAIITWICRVLV